MKTLPAKQMAWMTLPVVALFAFPLISRWMEKPPAIDTIELREITDEERLTLDDQSFDTHIHVVVEHPKVLLNYFQGSDVPKMELIGPKFFDQTGKRISVKMGDWGIDDGAFCDFDLFPLPKGVKKVSFKMKIKVDDKWTLPVSVIAYEEPR
ncbi:hypothetical protein EON83_26880 [bacterium]|nr:MAG: hypothetical protein EON83_26880 [bacterium]